MRPLPTLRTTDRISRPDEYRAVRRRARRDGLLFGIASGLTFALAAWGWDAWQLVSVSVTFGWFKLVIGGLACLVVGGSAGWLVARADSGLAGLVGWAFAGACFGFLAGRLPMQGASLFAGSVDPRFAGLDVYPLVPVAEGKANLITVLSAILGALTGIFELVAVDQAGAAHSKFGHGPAPFMCAPILILAGVTADIISNQQLREPQVNLVRLVRFDLEH